MSHRRLADLPIVDLFLAAGHASYVARDGTYQDLPADLMVEAEQLYRLCLSHTERRFRVEDQAVGWRATAGTVKGGTRLYVLRPGASLVPAFGEQLARAPGAVRQALEAAGRKPGLLVVSGEPVQGKTWTAGAIFARWMDAFGPTGFSLEEPPELPLQGLYQRGRCWQLDVGAVGLGEAADDILRQGTRLVLVGEILSRETARIAVRLGQAGLSVIATFHAGDIPGTIQRLHDLLVAAGHDDAPSALAQALQGVLHQRLARDPDGGRWAEVSWIAMETTTRAAIQQKRWGQLREEQRVQAAAARAP